MTKKAWINLVRKKLKEAEKKGLRGLEAFREAYKEARKEFVKLQKRKGGPAEYKKGLSGRKIRSLGLGRGLGTGKGKGPLGIPRKAKTISIPQSRRSSTRSGVRGVPKFKEDFSFEKVTGIQR